MSEAYADTAEVENPDAGAYEAERPDNRDQRYEREENEGGEAEERPPQRRPDPNQAAARQRRELREERDRRQALEQRLERLEREKASSGAPADPFETLSGIDVDKDPVGAVAAVKDIALSLRQERTATTERERQQQQQQQHITGLSRWASEFETDFKDAHPDYDKAVAHVAKSLTEELKAGGYSDAQANAALSQQLLGVLENCRRQGLDPAASIYAIAGKRGYKLDNGADMAQQKQQGQRGVSPFAGTGTRAGAGGVSVNSVANAPRATLSTIRAGGDDFEKGFAKLKAAAKPRR